MAASSFNRETARDKLATLLDAAMVGTPAVAQAVYNYKVRKLNAQSPVVTVDSSGSGRVRDKTAGGWDTNAKLTVTVFVLWSKDGSSWTEANCEDRLDLIEKTIADVLLDHKSTSQDATVPWDTIEFDGDSAQDTYIEGGLLYWVETIPVKARKING